MAKSVQEMICEGWLTKSPPTKRIWRARWRRRWFLLTQSGELPGQYILTYYTDRNCRKLKGVINLDQCEQVDLGLKLDERKLKFDHVFDIKTPTRTYYLAADTEEEMKAWVTCICKVCGLKSTTEEEDLHMRTDTADIEITEEASDSRSVQETPPISPVSTSPYIPISECITGKSPIIDSRDFKNLLEYNTRNNFFNSYNSKANSSYDMPSRRSFNYVNDIQDPRFYDSPRQLTLPKTESDKNCHKNQSPLHSPTDSDSVFNDEEWTHSPSELNTSKKSRPSDSSTDVDIVATKRFTKVPSDNVAMPPPRPPKPAHIISPASYLNLTPTKTKEGEEDRYINKDPQKVITDDMYDFPRSHHIENEAQTRLMSRRHCYNNAAPVNCSEGTIFRYDVSPKPSTSSTVFIYDPEVTGHHSQSEMTEPASPAHSAHSRSSSLATYSNLPSPALFANEGLQLVPPPAVNRDLKPTRRKLSSGEGYSGAEPPSPRVGGPNVDRKLKPPTPAQDPHMRKSFNPNDDELRKLRAAPSPVPFNLGRSQESLLSQNKPEQDYQFLPGKMQYLDLDLDSGFSNAQKSVPKTQESDTVYKKVDFVATQAFTITRNILEKERQEPVTFLKK